MIGSLTQTSRRGSMIGSLSHKHQGVGRTGYETDVFPPCQPSRMIMVIESIRVIRVSRVSRVIMVVRMNRVVRVIREIRVIMVIKGDKGLFG